MIILAAIAITCWLCALIATPRKPLPDNEVQELVYARLLGRQQWLMFIALILTGAAILFFVMTLHHQVDAYTNLLPDQVCIDRPGTAPTCYTRQPGGGWLVEQLQADGTFLQEGLVSSPPSDTGYDGSGPP